MVAVYKTDPEMLKAVFYCETELSMLQKNVKNPYNDMSPPNWTIQ